MKKCPICKNSRAVRPVPSSSALDKWILKPLFYKRFQCEHCGKHFRRITRDSKGRPAFRIEPESEDFPQFLKKDGQSFDEMMKEMREFEQRLSVREEDSSFRSKRSSESLTVFTNPGKTKTGN